MTAETGIVVPLDGSRISENAVPFAAFMARLYDEPVRFVHVLEGENLPTAADREGARSRFEQYASELAERWGIAKSVAEVRDGPPAAAILDYAGDARFLTVASHGRGGFRATVIGSVADKVVRASTRPVFFIPGVGKPEEVTLDTILVPLDGSAEAERALEVARDLAARAKAKVALVRAWQLPPPGGFEYSYYSEDVIATFKTTAEQYIANVAKPDETRYVAQGAAAMVIQEAATQFDAGLVVMTSSGKGLARRLALGSITDRMMHTLHRPLLIIPPAKE
jgi:nucleotide-binding universal stress UspA family protein